MLSMGKPTMSIVIFNSYFDIARGIWNLQHLGRESQQLLPVFLEFFDAYGAPGPRGVEQSMDFLSDQSRRCLALKPTYESRS